MNRADRFTDPPRISMSRHSISRIFVSNSFSTSAQPRDRIFCDRSKMKSSGRKATAFRLNHTIPPAIGPIAVTKRAGLQVPEHTVRYWWPIVLSLTARNSNPRKFHVYRSNKSINSAYWRYRASLPFFFLAPYDRSRRTPKTISVSEDKNRILFNQSIGTNR